MRRKEHGERERDEFEFAAHPPPETFQDEIKLFEMGHELRFNRHCSTG